MTQNSNNLNQTLNERLKCHICGGQARAGKARWYSCPAQHKICQDCKEVEKIEWCSLGCQKPHEYGKIMSQHCRVIEELLKNKTMQFKCTNSCRGCQEFLKEETMIEHETECIYRLVICPDLGLMCKTEVTYANFLQHWDEKHFPAQYELKTLHVSKSSMKFVKDGRTFIFTGLLDMKENECESTFYFWILMVGSKLEAKNYYYKIKFYGRDDSKVRNFYSAKVLSIDETPNKIDVLKENASYQSINYYLFKTRFLNENLMYKIRVDIDRRVSVVVRLH